MKNNRFIGRMLSALLIAIMLITMMPLAFASRCPENPDGDHYWGEWDTDRKATCSRAGQKSRACKYCRKVDTKSIPKKSHSYGSWKTTKEATCTRKGERTRKCTVCGHKSTDSIKMKAHSWGEWTVITEPTEFTTGISEHTCKVCGKTAKQDIYPEGTLKKGDKGDEVKELQAALNDNGYDCGTVDGDFGKKTEKAVKGLETAIGVEPDGIAWPGVVNALVAEEEEPAQPETTSGNSCTVQLKEMTTPANGSFYQEGENITYGCTVTNTSSSDADMPIMYDIDVYDPLIRPDAGDVMSHFDGIMPGSSDSLLCTYEVTAADVERGYIENTVTVTWVEADAGVVNIGESRSAASNTVIVYAGFEEAANVYLEKTVESIPANGEYYVLGEEIRYFLRLTNEGEEPITDVEIVDYLKGSNEDALVDRAESVEPGGSLAANLTYTVTESDVSIGYVENEAYGYWNEGGPVISDYTKVETGPIGETYYFTLSDVAYVGEEYSNLFYVQHLRENASVFGAMNELTSNLGILGLSNRDDAGDSGVWIDVSGTPTQTGEASCKYSVLVDGDLWYIEVDMIVVERVNGVSMVKRCTSTPGSEYGYAEGETVSYQVVISNDSENDLYNTEFTDSLVKGADCTIEAISAGDTYTVEYDYTVTAKDMERGYMENTASLAFTQGADTATAHSNTVYVPTNSDYEPEIDEMPVWLNKERTNSPADANGYVEGEVIEYEVTVYNDSELNVYGATLFDPLMDEPKTVNVASGDSYTVQYSYTVQSGDVDLGYVDNTAELHYMSGDAAPETVTSKTIHTITQRVIDPVPDEPVHHTVTLLKERINTPNDPAGYVEGEYIEYRLTVSVSDGIYPDGWVMFKDDLVPELSNSYHRMELPLEYSYRVTEEDAIRGYVDNTAIVCYWDTDENGYMRYLSTTSNTVHTITMKADPSDPVEPGYGVDIVKTETSAPKNGQYYVKGETIHYSITYTNVSTETLDEIVMMDVLEPGDQKIRTDTNVAPGEVLTVDYDYKVTQNDIDTLNGYICNFAYSSSVHDGFRFNSFSNLVFSPIGEDSVPTLDPDPRPNIKTPVMEGDCCVRTIVSRGNDYEEYTLHYCATHHATETAVEAMVNAAATPTAKLTAWQYARTLWQADIAVMYDALMAAANGPAKVIVLNERALFEAQAATHEATLNAIYPDQPELVAREIAELYMNRCVDMCYELHTAPEPRADDLLSVELTADIAAGRTNCENVVLGIDGADVSYQEQLCAAHTITATMMNAMANTASPWSHAETLWRQELSGAYSAIHASTDANTAAAANAEERAFKSWLRTRSELLTLLYPEQKDVVEQLTVKTVMNRVLEMCEGIQ